MGVHESIDDCCGSRTFYRKLPCVRYKLGEGDYCEYSYPNALIFSFFLGIVGADRFYLGLTATAVGKLFSLGGLDRLSFRRAGNVIASHSAKGRLDAHSSTRPCRQSPLPCTGQSNWPTVR